MTALGGPGEEVQEGLLAGPWQVNIRKPLSQEVNRLLRQQHPGAGCLGDRGMPGLSSICLLTPMGAPDPSLSTLRPFSSLP